MNSSPQINDFPLLLEVFRTGLKRGLVSKEEVIAWADQIIMNAAEPEYFFIELSLSPDLNSLLEVLDKNVEKVDNPICERVLLAQIYHGQPIFDVEHAESIAVLVGSLYSWNTLTPFENSTICQFDDYYLHYASDSTQLQVELINFLDIYKAFTLGNYTQWTDINLEVLELLKQEEIKANAVSQSLRKAWVQQQRKTNRALLLKKFGVILIIFSVFFGLSILFDTYGNYTLSFYFLSIYFLLRISFGLWQKKKAINKTRKCTRVL